MPAIQCDQVEVYVFRRSRRARRVEFLALRRAPGRRLRGVWQPVTGRLRRGEAALAAAVRELREETGLSPRRWWALESMTIWFDPASDTVHLLPLFAAEIGPGDEVKLSPEHDAHAFLPAAAAARRYLWLAQKLGLAAVRREVLAGGALAVALEVTGLAARGARRTRRSA